MVAGKPRRSCPECGYIHFVEPRVGVGVMVIEAAKLFISATWCAAGKRTLESACRLC